MKKLFAMATLFLALLLGTPTNSLNAEPPQTQLIQVSELVKAYENSVFIIKGSTMLGMASKGTCFCFWEDKGSYYFLTAEHLTDKVNTLKVLINKQEVLVPKWTNLPNSDVSWFALPKQIGQISVLPLDLSPEAAVVEAYTISFWGMTTQLSGTFGKVDRSVSGPITEQVYDFYLKDGFIAGTVLISPGCSGGPLLNKEHKVIGVNVTTGYYKSQFIDIRSIFNKIPEVNKGKLVKIPVSENWDVMGVDKFSRIPVKDSDILRVQKLKTAGNIKAIKEFFSSKNVSTVTISQYFNENTQLILSGKVYYISLIRFDSRKLSYSDNNIPKSSNQKYIYLNGDGWYCFIHLSDET